MKVVLIEDEIHAFEYLKSILLQVEPEAEVLAHLDSVQDSVNWFVENPMPDLVFLDIQLADGMSFEIFNHVTLTTPIIFTTAYDQYAIDAFKVNSVDYLLKPIHKDDLLRALKKYKVRQSQSSVPLTNQLKHLMGEFNRKKKNRCLVKKGKHFEFVEVRDIAFVNSEDSVTFCTHAMQDATYIPTR